ncbi:MAG TPA: histidine kinase [Gaiellaceae bacterium]|nr:histidine kinase [Gaiellaceae bacterium]
MAAAASALRPRQARQAAPLLSAALAVAYAVAVMVALNQAISADAATTYAAVSLLAHAADLTAGLAVLAAGVVALLAASDKRLGSQATSLGILWFAPDWEAWAGHPLARSLGSVAAPFLLVVVLHLVLAAPRGRLRSRTAVAAVGGAYALTALFAVGRALLRDPFLDPYCWRNCVDNAFLVHRDERIAHDLGLLLLGLTVAVGLLSLAVAGVRMARASAAARRALMPILAPAAFAGTAAAAYAVAILHTPFEEPRASEFLSLFYARSFGVAALALGIAWRIASDRRTRSAVARLTADLGEAPPPGKLQNVLADAVGDPTLRVAYWLETSRRFVGTDGNDLPEPVPEAGRAVTPILRRRQRLAVVTHDVGVVDEAVLERELRPGARLAVENERLQAEVLAELEDLRRSRARIVERGDRERQRLERNLHDGAQQHLLALSYDLRLARASAEAGGDLELAGLVDSAMEDAQAALEELRELAHGIYPAILAEAGLGPALETLVDEASLPVELKTMPPERQPSPVEAAAYFAVAEAVDDAAARAATSVQVDVKCAGGRLLVAVDDDGRERSSSLGHVADRIGALGGSLELGPTTLRASVPCA